jgi:hypothetical protein
MLVGKQHYPDESVQFLHVAPDTQTPVCLRSNFRCMLYSLYGMLKCHTRMIPFLPKVLCGLPGHISAQPTRRSSVRY